MKHFQAKKIRRPQRIRLIRAETDGCACAPRLEKPRLFSHSMMKALICATVLLQTGALFAEPVSDVRARVAASAYLGQNYAPSSIAKAARRLATPSLLSAGTCRELIGAEGVIGFVVQLSPSGFIVVRADDELSPVKLHQADAGGPVPGNLALADVASRLRR